MGWKMPVKVLIVDDSNFFQHRLKDIISEHPELHVVGIASNGLQAVELAEELKPDVITMDFEMPVMDGVTAVKHILAKRRIPILMFSSLTYEGARITLDALAAGAADFLAKDFAEVTRNPQQLKRKLHDRILALAGAKVYSSPSEKTSDQTNKPSVEKPESYSRTERSHSVSSNGSAPIGTTSVDPARTSLANIKRANSPSNTSAGESDKSSSNTDNYQLKTQPQLLIVGASTGGPVALSEVLTQLPANFPLPIVLVQHMPENFTKAFAERLNKQCKIRVREAVDGDHLEAGLALLAPGGKQLLVDRRNNSVRIRPDDKRVNYKPSLDITFGSAANTYGDKVLGVVLTGMGSDGCQGARLLKEAGSVIWSQDEASCVIYGMPAAVARAGLTDKVLSLKEIGPRLVREVM